ncbi:histidine phosphatase family protein [Sulfobacillus acidophilus]|uniref:Histidine phosphatase family protein n=1 Tax=Sulfobacillus acidophilus TaxID=53633 RepID=A0ABS3AX37_9FIRM|nr:histidine phosphatase family protein [Sulfobacillus acidophilus]
MQSKLQEVVLIRHGETEWTKNGQHTSFTDLDLTENGKVQAKKVKTRIEGRSFAKVFCSPLKRAKQTCEICGLLDQAEILPDLTEWNYGKYEGITTVEVRKTHQDWLLWTHGAPGGESPEQVAKRANNVIEKILSAGDDVAIFSSGHFMRMLITRWLELPPIEGRRFYLSTASYSLLGFEREIRVVKTLNDTSHC